MLTERGKVALAYAMISSPRHRAHRQHRLSVRSSQSCLPTAGWVSHHLPKLLAHQLISAATECEDFPIHLVWGEAALSSLTSRSIILISYSPTNP